MAKAAYSVHSVHSPGGQKRFRYLKGAKSFAQAEANRRGTSVAIFRYGEPILNVEEEMRGDDYEDKYRGNPTSLPRGKWIKAQVRVTKSGKIEAKIPGRSRSKR